MEQEEKQIRMSLEDVGLKGTQVDEVVTLMGQKSKIEPIDTTNDQGDISRGLLDLESKILNEQDPIKRANLIAMKISFKLENYQY